jgi:2-dehydro-3-deoxygalactonokinase
MIAVDWGTSSLRVYRLDTDGVVVEARRSDQGVLASHGRFEQVLAAQLAGWDDPLVVMSGMVGSRQGWQEAPYVECPAGLAEIAAGLQRLRAHDLKGREIWIAPGLSIRGDGGLHDVMRGEETQLCGLLGEAAQGRHQVCLAGTHSKLAVIEDGRIATFFTAMTGELYALLCEHSILGRSMKGDAHDPDAFARGVDEASRDGDLLHHLFAVRTHGLFGELPATALRSYLSGLLIGHELNMLPAGSNPVLLVASPSLLAPYRRALNRRGRDVREYAEAIAVQGLHAIARQRGLIGARP